MSLGTQLSHTEIRGSERGARESRRGGEYLKSCWCRDHHDVDCRVSLYDSVFKYL